MKTGNEVDIQIVREHLSEHLGLDMSEVLERVEKHCGFSIPEELRGAVELGYLIAKRK